MLQATKAENLTTFSPQNKEALWKISEVLWEITSEFRVFRA